MRTNDVYVSRLLTAVAVTAVRASRCEEVRMDNELMYGATCSSQMHCRGK